MSWGEEETPSQRSAPRKRRTKRVQASDDDGVSPSGKASRLGGTFGGEYNKNINYTVYVLKSKKNDRYYIGQTNNLKERLRRHDSGQVLSTKHRRPLLLIHTESFQKRSEAMKREKYLKSLKRGNEWKALEKRWGVAKW